VNPGFVADASVAVAWVVESQSTDATDRLFVEVVPVLWMFEVANALLMLMRRRRIDRQGYDQARLDLSNLRPLVDAEGPKLALDSICDLAEKHVLSVYDASYLELALRKTVPLASRDSALNKAAKRAGVRTLL